MWELALGGLIAVCTISLRRLPALFAAALSWIGLASILVAAFLFTSATAYPGGAVALPVVGAALIIAGGVADPSYGVERLLRLRPFQWIGMISYSLYLWHWPVLTIAAERRGTDSLPVTDALLWLLLSLGLAVITYLLVENPIRHSTFLVSKRWASLALGGCLIVSSLTVATAEIHLHDQGTLAAPGLANLKTSDPCPSPTNQEVKPLMGVGPTTNHRLVARLMVVGDSTACTMLAGLEAAGAPLGVRVENAAVIGCGVVSGQVAPYIYKGRDLNSGSRFCQSKANAVEARALRAGFSQCRLVGEHLGEERTGCRKRCQSKGACPRIAAVVRRIVATNGTAGTAIHLDRCHCRDAHSATFLAKRKSNEADPPGQGLRAPERPPHQVCSPHASR